MQLPFFLTAGLGAEGSSPRSGRVAIEVARCTSDRERDWFVRTLACQGQTALREELSIAPAIGSVQFDARVPWILRYAREMPQDGGGTRLFLATERPMSAVAIWDDPRYADYPFMFIDLLFDADGAVTGSVTMAARLTADASGGFVNIEAVAMEPIQITDIRLEHE